MLLGCLWGIHSGKTKWMKRSHLFSFRAICEEYDPSGFITIGTSLVTGNANPYLGSKLLSLTIHSLFSGTLFHLLGSAKSTKALALSSPNPNLLLTIRPAPFFFHPGFPASGSYSEVHTTKCCISLHVRSGLFGKCSWLVFSGLSIIFLSITRLKQNMLWMHMASHCFITQSMLHLFSQYFSGQTRFLCPWRKGI